MATASHFNALPFTLIALPFLKKDGDGSKPTFTADLIKAARKQCWHDKWKWLRVKLKCARLYILSSHQFRRVQLLFHFAPPHMWCVCWASATIEAHGTIIYSRGNSQKHRVRVRVTLERDGGRHLVRSTTLHYLIGWSGCWCFNSVSVRNVDITFNIKLSAWAEF